MALFWCAKQTHHLFSQYAASMMSIKLSPSNLLTSLNLYFYVYESKLKYCLQSGINSLTTQCKLVKFYCSYFEINIDKMSYIILSVVFQICVTFYIKLLTLDCSIACKDLAYIVPQIGYKMDKQFSHCNWNNVYKVSYDCNIIKKAQLILIKITIFRLCFQLYDTSNITFEFARHLSHLEFEFSFNGTQQYCSVLLIKSFNTSFLILIHQ